MSLSSAFVHLRVHTEYSIVDSVVRIDAQGRVEVLAEAAQGATGSTSVALARDGRTAYVTTNGGMFLPPAGEAPRSVVVTVMIGSSTFGTCSTPRRP